MTIDSKEELYAYFTPQNKSKPRCMEVLLSFIGTDPQWEEQLKNDLKVTVRCIPKIRASLVPVSFRVMKVPVVSYWPNPTE